MALTAAAEGYGPAALQPHLSTMWVAVRAELLAPAAPALLPADLASAQQVSHVNVLLLLLCYGFGCCCSRHFAMRLECPVISCINALHVARVCRARCF